MNSKTVLAIILLSLLFAAFMFVGRRYEIQEDVGTQNNSNESFISNERASSSQELEYGVVSEKLSGMKNLEEIARESRKSIVVKTNLYEIEFSSYGASIVSLKLKNYLDNENLLEMIQRGSNTDWGAFLLYFGSDNSGQPFYGPYTFADKGNGVYEFRSQASLTLKEGSKVPFTVLKTYRFLPDEYMFELRVSLIQPNGEYLPLDFSGYSYVLETGPQIGPGFKKLDGTQVYRKPSYYNGKKVKFLRIASKPINIENRVIWAGIDGKYFTIVGIPDESRYKKTWTSRKVQTSSKRGFLEGSQLSFVRSLVRSSRQEDRFYFYFGPKKVKDLRSYNYANHNGFGLANLHLEALSPSFPVIGWFQAVFKLLLELIHRFVRNWGWSIIILTIIVKLILFPLSVKSMISTARMGELAPKIKVLQERYKDDPTALHRAQFELYRNEGVNPMSGCLPLIIQLPIFISLYNLFNRFFELRGAPFFGWIKDLSAPDTVLSFENALPFLNWNSLHILPIIYLCSQCLMNKVTQSDSGRSGQMKLLMWVMPIVFFFIFYEVASALLVYWILSNMLSVFQQLFIIHLKKSGYFDVTQKKRTKKLKTINERRGL